MDHRKIAIRQLTYYLKHRYCPEYRVRARQLLRGLRWGRDASFKRQREKGREVLNSFLQGAATIERLFNPRYRL